MPPLSAFIGLLPYAAVLCIEFLSTVDAGFVVGDEAGEFGDTFSFPAKPAVNLRWQASADCK